MEIHDDKAKGIKTIFYDGRFWRRHYYYNRNISSSRYYVGWINNKIVYLHRYLWKKHHGDLPARKKLVFIDGDFDNITIENLRLVNSGEAYQKAYNDTKKVVALAAILDNNFSKWLLDNKDAIREFLDASDKCAKQE